MPLTYDPESAVTHLRSGDAMLAGVIDAIGPFTMEPRDGAFRQLSRAIFFQQLAGPAARAIMNRVLAALGTDEERWYAPQQMLAASEDQLRAAGLSRQKTVYIRDVADKFASGDLSEDEFAHLDDEAVVQQGSLVVCWVTERNGDGPRFRECNPLESYQPQAEVYCPGDGGHRSDIDRCAPIARVGFAASDSRDSHGSNCHWRSPT